MAVWVWTGLLWLSLSAVLWGGMLSFAPREVIRRHTPHLPPVVWRFLRGDMAVGGRCALAWVWAVPGGGAGRWACWPPT
ncbi:hypothetical protein SERAS_05680 [Serratia marcescens]|nr:hypothetical protein SERAS_05680 [Serratia marcescens]